MKTIRTGIAAVAVVMTALAGMADQAAPAFELPDVQGDTHTLAQYKGKIVVLEWTNYDCPFVKKFYSVGAMQRWQEKYTGEDVVWLSVCSSAPGKQGHFTRETWLKRMQDSGVKATAVLLDADGKVGKAYKASNTPHMYVIGKDGNLIYQGAIDDKRSAKPGDIETARNYVVEALTAVMSDKPVAVAETKAYGCSVKY